jgi:hypothetical protein
MASWKATQLDRLGLLRRAEEDGALPLRENAQQDRGPRGCTGACFIMRYMMLCAMALIFVACGGDTTEPPMSLDGEWEGHCDCPPYDAGITMTLSHNTRSGYLTGAGGWSGTWGQLGLTVSGTVALPNVSLTLVASAGPFTPGTMTCSGTVTASQMSCTLRGPAFSPVLILFTRR